MNSIISLLAQSAFFIFGVYLEKFIRKRLFSPDQRKKVKQTMRIVSCAIMTTILLLYNYQESCEPFGINFSQCFYLNFDLKQLIHVFVANSILFGAHIYEKCFKNDIDWSRYTIKSVFIAPILEQFLFRASFFRTSRENVSIFLLSIIFSLCHLHKPIRKAIKGKKANWNASLGQVIFTFVFGAYSFYFLSTWFSVVPSMLLHCYCNFLGPPRIRKDNLHWHVICIISIIAYCFLFVSN